MELPLYRTNLCSWVSSSSIDKSSNVGPPCKSISRPALETYASPRKPQYRRTFRTQREGIKSLRAQLLLFSLARCLGVPWNHCVYLIYSLRTKSPGRLGFFVLHVCPAVSGLDHRKVSPPLFHVPADTSPTPLRTLNTAETAGRSVVKSSEPWPGCPRSRKRGLPPIWTVAAAHPPLLARKLLHRRKLVRAGDSEHHATSAPRESGSAMETAWTVAGEKLWYYVVLVCDRNCWMYLIRLMLLFQNVYSGTFVHTRRATHSMDDVPHVVER